MVQFVSFSFPSKKVCVSLEEIGVALYGYVVILSIVYLSISKLSDLKIVELL